MIDIEKMEDVLYHYFTSGIIRPLVGTALACRMAQDLGPQLADFLHDHGVVIDWSDGSRYGTEVAK